ncbi:Acetyltransferase (GNAT) family protein [Arboricoccus pini]|uniref:Acetyltransferase (GNAT) family protein n=1 Tax=Arboricoccus pini TaxID=1963835 RepID=A0A212QQ22_9PROT|nr:GNAT family N-acetyltransferase [Arboricoccus pini]SNB61495.1 Acetyltransferase (GNAT) family protein [Arboricoccus pini]
MASEIVVRMIEAKDEDVWRRLWAGYLTFYRKSLTEEMTSLTFARLLDPGLPVFGAVAIGPADTPVGLVHYLHHLSTWSPTFYCYLEDLFVAPEARGGGYGRALIQHVYDAAHAAGATNVYWLTEGDNATAQRLYDRIGQRSGFIHYWRPR